MKHAWAVVVTVLSNGPAVLGATVWSGHTHTFTKVDLADPSLPENQDRITDNVWITRADLFGIYNAAVEPMYMPISPADTEWAFGKAEDWESLTFTTWKVWHNNDPPGTIGQDAVVHLITDDIYIDIRFLQWTPMGQGGGFSYIRAVPSPSAAGVLMLGAVRGLSRRRR